MSSGFFNFLGGDKMLLTECLTANTEWELEIMVQNFMHDKLIYHTEYFFDGLFYNCSLIYEEF